MKVSKIILGITAIGAFAFGAAQTANALPVLTGGVSYSGGYVAEDSHGNVVTDLTLATQIVFTSPGVITGATGTLANFGGLGSLITLDTPLIISPLTPLSPLYSYSNVNGTVSFGLDTLGYGPGGVTATTLALQGSGDFTATGFAQTGGTWIATFNTLSDTFSFSASSAATPDGGSTVALLGGALVGIGALRRKFGVFQTLGRLLG